METLRMHTKTNIRERGFTLLELMIVLVILAILVTLAIPMFDMVEKRRVRGAAEEIYSAAQFARSEAIKQSRDMFFVAGISADGANWCVGVGNVANCNCLNGACTERNTVFNVATTRTNLVDNAGAALAAASPVSAQFEFARGTVVGVGDTVRVQHTAKPSAANRYQLNVVISRMGRVQIESPNAQNDIYYPEYKQ
jgi:type IV fimbrial biogenesis protein FimT